MLSYHTFTILPVRSGGPCQLNHTNTVTSSLKLRFRRAHLRHAVVLDHFSLTVTLFATSTQDIGARRPFIPSTPRVATAVGSILSLESFARPPSHPIDRPINAIICARDVFHFP